MIFDSNYVKLPKIYIRAEKECYLDPVRQKLIYVTPEETVRQRMISFLIYEMKIDSHMITVEEHLSHYGIDSKQRADIIIRAVDDKGIEYPLCVIECKAPDIPLTEEVANQMFDYCDAIGADYAFMTNGYNTLCYKYDSKINNYIPIEKIPSYQNMIKGKYIKYDSGEFPERIPFDKLTDWLTEQNNSYDDPHDAYDISPMTDMKIAVPAFNLVEGLWDYRVKIPEGDYGLFKIIEDMKVRMLSFGNSSGGIFSGPYRSFLIEINGNTEIVSIALGTYCTWAKQDILKTSINVGIENEKEKHHALQMVLDDNMIIGGNVCHFFHNGRIAVGNIGSGKISELREFVKRKRPDLIKDKRFYLGSLVHDRLWRLDDPEVIKLITNLISYALIRDEYREYKKTHKVEPK